MMALTRWYKTNVNRSRAIENRVRRLSNSLVNHDFNRMNMPLEPKSSTTSPQPPPASGDHAIVPTHRRSPSQLEQSDVANQELPIWEPQNSNIKVIISVNKLIFIIWLYYCFCFTKIKHSYRSKTETKCDDEAICP